MVQDKLEFGISESNLLQVVINAVPAPIFFKDSQGAYLGCNTAFEDYIGLKREEFIGKGVKELFDLELAEIYDQADRTLFESGGKQVYETQVDYADGTRRDVMFHKAVFHADEENVEGIVGVILDITDRKQSENELLILAHQDSLTLLENRYSLLKSLSHAVALANRNESLLAFIMIDLDDFKNVNDSYGHPVGDALLVEVAQRLKHHMRESDTVARLGGDEFAIILENVEDIESVKVIARGIADEFKDVISVQGHLIHAGLTMGVALAPLDSEDRDELVKFADIALYRQKACKKGGYCFFGES